MPSSEPFQWTPYSSRYHVALDQISFNGKDLFPGNLGEFMLDRVARVSHGGPHMTKMTLKKSCEDL